MNKKTSYAKQKSIAFVFSPSASHELKSYRFGYESMVL
jgi:hypothetical protein